MVIRTSYETRLHDIDKNLQAWRDGTETARIEELNRWLSDDSEKNELTTRVEATRLAAQESRRLNSEVKQVEALIIRDSARSEQLRRVMESWEAYGNLELADAQRRVAEKLYYCLFYTSPSPRDRTRSRMPSFSLKKKTKTNKKKNKTQHQTTSCRTTNERCLLRI